MVTITTKCKQKSRVVDFNFDFMQIVDIYKSRLSKSEHCINLHKSGISLLARGYVHYWKRKGRKFCCKISFTALLRLWLELKCYQLPSV